MKKLILVLAIVAMCGSIAQAITSDATGTYNGFYYMLYHSGGSVNMTFGSSAGNFAITWSGVTDVVAGMGWSTGSSSRSIGYNCGTVAGNFMGIYGWTTSPLVEYYVTEYGANSAGTNMGTVTSDGSSYTVYHHQQVSQPSIIGTATFWQNIDIRSSQRTAGTITMANHFSSWSSKGMSYGSQNLQVLAVEAYGGVSGYANCTVWDAGSGSSTTTTTTSGSTTTTSGGTTLNTWSCNNYSSGLTIWTGGVGGWTVGAWIEFNNINLSGVTNMTFNLASTGSGQFAIRIDSTSGTQIGTLSYSSTGGWSTYQNKSTSLSNASGTHNLYIVDTSGAANVGTITIQ